MELQDMITVFNVFTPLTFLSESMLLALCWKETSLNVLTHAKLINLVVTCTDDCTCTCHRLTIPDKKLKSLREL